MRALCAVAVSLLAGCSPSRTTLRARIDSSSPLASLEARVSIGGGAFTMAQTLPVALPGDLVVILPDVATLVALDLDGTTTVGSKLAGSATATSVPHEEVLVAITLGAPRSDGGGDGVLDGNAISDGSSDGSGSIDSSVPFDAALDFAVADLAQPDLVPGKSFVLESSPVAADFYGLWGSGPTDVYVSGAGGVILHSAGDGKWVQQNSTVNVALTSGLAFSLIDAYDVGDMGTILHSTGNGQWVAQTSNVVVPLAAMWASAPNDLYAVGFAGTVLRSTGNGTWTATTAPSGANLYGIWGSGANDIFVVGQSGAIFHTVNQGASWTDQSINLGGGDVNGVWGASGTNLFGACDGGKIVHGNGMAFLAESTPVIDSLEWAWGSGPTDVYAVGIAMVHSSDGTNWSNVPLPTGNYLYRIWGTAADNIYVVGFSSTILHLK